MYTNLIPRFRSGIQAGPAILIGTLPLLLTVSVVRAAPGEITTIAGTGDFGFTGDGGPATEAKFEGPDSVAVDAEGHLYIADRANHRIRKVDALTGTVTTVAGTGTGGFSGDGGLATLANLNQPSGVAIDRSGNLFIADYNNHRVRRVDTGTGIITTYAGLGTPNYNGDGIAAVDAQLQNPIHVSFDPEGNLLIMDYWNMRVRKVDLLTGLISTVAGNSTQTFAGDGGPATEASFDLSTSAISDLEGNIYIANWANHRIRRVDAVSGIITTYAGTGTAGSAGDGGPADEAQLNRPYGLVIDAAGNLFFSESHNHGIRRIDHETGIITRIAGDGTSGFAGDGGPAAAARQHFPLHLAFNAAGDLFIGEAGNQRVRKIEAAGSVGRFQPDNTIGKTSSIQFGGGIHNLTGDSQKIQARSTRGRTIRFHATVWNTADRGHFFQFSEVDGEIADSLTILATKRNRFFTPTYSIPGGSGNVTGSITGKGLALRDLVPGASASLKVTVKPKLKKGRKGRTFSIRTTSTGDPTRQDLVRATLSSTARKIR